MSGQNTQFDARADARADTRSQVLAATDIVELIGQSVALKRRGKNYVGLCPFHQEKTGSFHVSPTRQSFHCFGCKAAGSAIDFVMKRDRVEFLDALKTLAARAGIDLPRFGVSKEKTSERQQVLEANSAACSFFEKLLAHPEQGRAAREYLATRRIDAESIKRFQIGYAPTGWDGLLSSPIGRKFTPAMLARAGLAKEKMNDRGNVVSHYDTFRNRLMFPIRDENSRIIAFGGRVMPGSDDPAKYLNSPETPVFSKSRCIFGMDLARQRIVETRTVAVVEGYTDVVMAHQCGVRNVVSVLGTALTEQHVAILRRFADRIVLIFDPDVAGDAAVERAVSLFLTQPVEIAIASLPEGLDPDEFVIRDGAEAFEKIINEAPGLLAHMTRQFKRKWDAAGDNSLEQDRAVRAFVDPFVKARAEKPSDHATSMRFGQVVASLSKSTGMTERQLELQYNIAARKLNQPGKQDVRSQPIKAAKLLTAQDRAEIDLLGSLLNNPHQWHQVQQHAGPEEFTDENRRKLAEIYWRFQQDEGEPVFNQFLAELQDPSLVELAVELVEAVEELPEDEVRLDQALAFFQEVRGRREEQKLMSQLRRTDAQLGEQNEVDLLRDLQNKRKQPDLRRVV